MPEGFVDPYIDPETGVLRNLVGEVRDRSRDPEKGMFFTLWR